jgi:hypothetical protein
MTTREKMLAAVIIVLALFAPYAAHRAFKMGVREGLNLVRVIGPTMQT